MNLETAITSHLEKIYSDQKLEAAKKLFQELLTEYNKKDFEAKERLSEKNVYLITYGDSFYEKGQAPLHVLNEIVSETLSDTITDIHLLPMFPYTSDDGFSVVDYLKINPDLGDWSNIAELAASKRLMFDFVANHMSKSSEWFQHFLEHDPDFKEAFITFDPTFDSKNVTRPRTSPLFHEYENKAGEQIQAWTTFSEDQVDVNAQDPKMLVRLTRVLLEYAKKGAASIRLDAIGFLWKESGTTSMHLPQTHEIIQLWRTMLDELVPNMQIITETNVPHQDNISYFGNGEDEANQVYQFPLPPLTLFSFITGNADKLTTWAESIHRVSDTGTYFNFLASHDGIGLRPTEGILTDAERQLLVDRVIENGGKISYKNNPDGSQSVYEMNINYSEALRDNSNVVSTEKRMIAAHHILLSVIGVPAIYYHSIFGSKNDAAAVEQTGINRRINREKLEKEKLLKDLNEDSYRQAIYEGITQLIKIRGEQAAFDPYGEQKVIKLDSRVFALRRINQQESILSLTNVSNTPVTVNQISGVDLVSGRRIEGTLELDPYDYVWIKEDVK
ncbi:sugar phosphorylase [Enterococcus sp. JM9B]|uniref:sugar phosphorylase n=1 Tax=Enterococcus sp. JM9B TaxID=1857216 RepID=UPI001374C1DC|nr:sugar phosphorylase [Enterococcus sp. JM9B]KAF1301897.1 alpha-amylase [Enterococcus sp. JM9B]